MIQKTVGRFPLNDPEASRRDLAYWRGRTAEERLSAVEVLRRQIHGHTARLQRTARVLEQPRG